MYQEHWGILGSDVAYARLPSQIQLPRVKVGALGKAAAVRVVANIPGPTNASAGTLTGASKKCFGMVEYDGSTRPGFSGSVYVWGDRVVGMHTCGGGINFGFAAAWIQAHLVRKEATADQILRKIFDSHEDFELDTTGDPSVVQVHYRGQFTLIERDDYDRIAADYEWSDDVAKPRKRKRPIKEARLFVEAEPEAGPGVREPLDEPLPEADDSELDFPPRSLITDTSQSLPETGITSTPVIGKATPITSCQQLDLDGLHRTLNLLLNRLDDMERFVYKPKTPIVDLPGVSEPLPSAGKPSATRTPSPAQTSTTSTESFYGLCIRSIQGLRPVLDNLTDTLRSALLSDGTVFALRTLEMLPNSESRFARDWIDYVPASIIQLLLEAKLEVPTQLHSNLRLVMECLTQATSSTSLSPSPISSESLLKVASVLYPCSALLTKLLTKSSSGGGSKPLSKTARRRQRKSAGRRSPPATAH
nr:hypothetical protein [Virus sp.]